MPIPEPGRPVYTELDARNVKVPSHFEVRAADAAARGAQAEVARKTE